MKKVLSMFLIVILLVTFMNSTVIGADGITVYYNETKINFDVDPVISGGRTMVPMRAIFETFGASVDYNSQNKKITAQKSILIITLTLNSNRVTINNNGNVSEVILDCMPILINGRTLVPLRFVGEALGASVKWDSSIRNVNITTSSSSNSKSNTEVVKKRIDYTNGYYYGDTLNDIRNGYGTYYWNEGDMYVGYWSNGYQDGYGVYSHADGTSFSGQWIDGQFIESETKGGMGVDGPLYNFYISLREVSTALENVTTDFFNNLISYRTVIGKSNEIYDSVYNNVLGELSARTGGRPSSAAIGTARYYAVEAQNEYINSRLNFNLHNQAVASLNKQITILQTIIENLSPYRNNNEYLTSSEIEITIGKFVLCIQHIDEYRLSNESEFNAGASGNYYTPEDKWSVVIDDLEIIRVDLDIKTGKLK